jgi:hypothetical protein
MNNLIDFIAENRTVFDCGQLPEGHEERFLNKIHQCRVQKRPFLRRYPLLNIAAMITIVVVSGLGLLVATNDSSLAINREMKIEIRMTQKYQSQMNRIEKQIYRYASEMSPSDWEQIEYTIESLAQNRDLLSETLPAEIPFAMRRAAIEAYYDQNLSGMQQIITILKQNYL